MRARKKYFGWNRQEAIGLDLPETIIPERYRENHRHGIKHFLASGEGAVLNRVIEMSALRRDGEEFPVELSISPIKTGDTVTFAVLSRTSRNANARRSCVRVWLR